MFTNKIQKEKLCKLYTPFFVQVTVNMTIFLWPDHFAILMYSYTYERPTAYTLTLILCWEQLSYDLQELRKLSVDIRYHKLTGIAMICYFDELELFVVCYFCAHLSC